MRQDSSKVGGEAFVNAEDALCRDSLPQAIENAIVEISMLVIESGHDGILHQDVLVLQMRKRAASQERTYGRMHEDTNNKAARR